MNEYNSIESELSEVEIKKDDSEIEDESTNKTENEIDTSIDERNTSDSVNQFLNELGPNVEGENKGEEEGKVPDEKKPLNENKDAETAVNESQNNIQKEQPIKRSNFMDSLFKQEKN